MKKLKIVFMGTAEFAVPTLEKLFKSGHDVVSVYSSSPKKANRGMTITQSPVSSTAKKFNLDLHYPDNLKSNDEYNRLKALAPDIIIVIAYGMILPPEILAIPKKGCFNLHASILPRWRGAAPIQRAMINGDVKTGISIIKIDEGLDTGDIVLKKEISIDDDDNYRDLEKKLSILGAESFENFFEKIENPELFEKQDDAKSSYAKKILKSEARIDWNDSASVISRKINAFFPKPGAWFEYESKRVKIIKAKKDDQSGIPGEVLDNNLKIACGENSVQIIEIQKEGKQSCSVEKFLLGNKINKGTILK